MKVKKTASGARVKRYGSARMSKGKGGMGLGKAGALVASPVTTLMNAKKMR